MGLARLGSIVALSTLVLAACAGAATRRTEPIGDCPTAPVPVVVSVDQWGDIVHQLAGDCGTVATIFTSSSADPHDFEPTPADLAKFTGAKLVVVNGLDYDAWAEKAVATLDAKPVVVNGGRVAGLRAGDNPHIWYGPRNVSRIAGAVTAKLEQLQPSARSYFATRHDAWRVSMKPYDDMIARIRPAAVGKTYGATEGIFDDMAAALGLSDRTPAGYRRAAANESEPAPGDVHDFEQALVKDRMTVLIDNTQTQGAIPEQIRSSAEDAHVPVVNVTESVPPRFTTFVAWQVSQLKALATALGA
jgi:zinc/manganese transport system substrate-binding protein